MVVQKGQSDINDGFMVEKTSHFFNHGDVVHPDEPWSDVLFTLEKALRSIKT